MMIFTTVSGQNDDNIVKKSGLSFETRRSAFEKECLGSAYRQKVPKIGTPEAYIECYVATEDNNEMAVIHYCPKNMIFTTPEGSDILHYVRKGH